VRAELDSGAVRYRSDPAHRRLGLGPAALLEAARPWRQLGVKVAYVGFVSRGSRLQIASARPVRVGALNGITAKHATL